MTDFGKDLFPRCVERLLVPVPPLDGYWEDLGTIKSYHDCHIALAGDSPPFQFHHADGIVYTRTRSLPPSRIVGAKLNHAIISDGSVVQAGTTIERSIVGVRSRIGRGAVLRDCILIGADRYESDDERLENEKRGRPHLTIGDEAVIERAILDKDCRIGRKVRIVNAKGVANAEGENYVIRDGIVVVPRGAIIPDGTDRPNRCCCAIGLRSRGVAFAEDQQQRAGDVDRAVGADDHADHHHEREQVHALAAPDVEHDHHQEHGQRRRGSSGSAFG